MANDLVITFKGDTADALNKVGGLKGALGGLGDFAGGVFKAGILGAAGLGAGVAAIGIPIAKIGIDFNAMKETAMTSFTVLLGSGEKANAMMGDLLKFAAQTPFEFEEIAKSARSLLTANVGPEKMQETLKRVGDVAAGLNIPFSELSDIYAKIQNQGRLYGEDINQLQGRGIPIIQELGKIYGATAGEVKKMVEEGKIGAPDIEQAFKNMTGEGGMFKDMMKAQSETFSGMMSTLSDNLNQLAGELAAPIFDVLKEGLTGVLALMDTPEFKQGIKDFAQVIGTTLKAGIEWLRQTLPGFIQNLQGTSQSFVGISTVIGRVWSFVQPILLSLFAELSKFWTEIQPKLAAAWDNIQKVTQQVFGAIVQFIQEHSTEIRMILDGAWKVIQGIFQTAWALISGIVKVALDLLAGDLDAAGRDFNQMIDGIWKGVQKITEGIWSEIQGYFGLVMSTIGKVIADKLEEIGGWFNEQFEEIVDYLAGLPDRFLQLGSDIIGGIINGLWARAEDIRQALSDIIRNALNAALKRIGLPPLPALGGEGQQSAFTGRETFGQFGNVATGNVSNSSVTIYATVRDNADIDRLVDLISDRLGTRAQHRIARGF